MTTRIRSGRLVDPQSISVKHSTYVRIANEARRLRQTQGATLDEIMTAFLDAQNWERTS